MEANRNITEKREETDANQGAEKKKPDATVEALVTDTGEDLQLKKEQQAKLAILKGMDLICNEFYSDVLLTTPKIFQKEDTDEVNFEEQAYFLNCFRELREEFKRNKGIEELKAKKGKKKKDKN